MSKMCIFGDDYEVICHFVDNFSCNVGLFFN